MEVGRVSEDNEGFKSLAAEQRLFGRFFKDVRGCRLLMSETSAIALGSAVLHALLSYAEWEPSDIGIFVQDESMDGDELFKWTEFLVAEGYRCDVGGGKGSLDVTSVSCE